MHRHGIAQRVLLKHESFYDHMFDGGRAYDVIHFASSFMLMPDQVPSPSSALASLVFLLHSIAAQRLALQHAKTIIKPGGVIIFAQTMEKKNFMGFMARYTKPLLTFFLRIDFGKVTYESDFYDLLRVRRSPLLLALCPSAAPPLPRALFCSHACFRPRATRSSTLSPWRAPSSKAAPSAFWQKLHPPAQASDTSLARV